MWLMIHPWDHCPTGGVFMVAKLKQIHSKSSPYDSHLGTLSVGQIMVVISLGSIVPLAACKLQPN